MDRIKTLADGSNCEDYELGDTFTYCGRDYTLVETLDNEGIELADGFDTVICGWGVVYPTEETKKRIDNKKESNVTCVNFDTRYSILEDLEKDLLKVAEKYSGQIPLASFIGVLEIVKNGYLNNET